ncbi:Insulinase family protein [Candidatus Hepatincolaceae symbiont of Richtersius coronifer]
MLNAKITYLNNGLTVVTDYLPYVNSATLGIWAKIGSRIENKANNGICHFLEHMVFKGTKKRTSFEISENIESRGGYMNAWTSKEKTAWYAKVLKDDINLALDILFDILKNSTFPPEELAKEKGVIIEEIKMYLDSPQDLAYNLYEKLCYNDNPLAYPIIGNEENINRFTSQDFINHTKKYYQPSKMVLVISGNFNEEEFFAELHKQNADWIDKPLNIHLQVPIFSSKHEIIIKKDIEQTALIYGLNGYSYKDEDYFKASVANTILGVGMSSRLFVEIREKRGLAYSVDSFLNSYEDCGTFAVQVGCNKDNVKLVIGLIKEEIAQTSNTLLDEEIEKAKNQLKSGILMSLESTSSRCERLAANILNFNEIRDLNKLISKINAVSKNDVIDVFNRLLSSKETIALVSNSDLAL